MVIIIGLIVAFLLGAYVGHRSGGRRAIRRLHDGNYKDMIRKLGL